MNSKALARRDPATMATPELRSYPVDGDVDALADHLRARLAELSLPLHETRIVPAGGRQYLLRPNLEGYEFGLVPRDALPAETVVITVDDGIATIAGEHLALRGSVVRSLIKAFLFTLVVLYAALIIFTALGPVLGVGLGLAATVASVVVFIVAALRTRDDTLRLRERRQRDVLSHVERAVRPMLRAELPGVPYR